MRFTPRTVTRIARPGNVVNHHASVMYSRASETITPHVGVRPPTPRPKKLNPDSARIVVATENVAITMMTPRTFGTRWRRRIRDGDAPIARAARTYSRVLSDKVSARTRRA